MSARVNALVVLDAAIQRAADDAAQYKYPDKDGEELKEVRSSLQSLMNSCDYLIKVLALRDEDGKLLEGPLQFGAVTSGIAALARIKGEKA